LLQGKLCLIDVNSSTQRDTWVTGLLCCAAAAAAAAAVSVVMDLSHAWLKVLVLPLPGCWWCWVLGRQRQGARGLHARKEGSHASISAS